ncbi:hypothetical protein A3711_07320 [Erythrobacter sp. HI00D59]|jgi:hypothetical protein|nr:hypothetical protein A3711_07320 [Erythrobacter sp. HI00D59]
MSGTEKYYFCFRQVEPRPPGRWVPQGPYGSYEEAKVARERAKAWDAEVGTPFTATDEDDARKRCEIWV